MKISFVVAGIVVLGCGGGGIDADSGTPSRVPTVGDPLPSTAAPMPLPAEEPADSTPQERPAPAEDFRVTWQGPRSIDLAWFDPNADTVGVRLVRVDAEGVRTPLAVPTGASSFLDAVGLSPGHDYQYVLSIMNAVGVSDAVVLNTRTARLPQLAFTSEVTLNGCQLHLSGNVEFDTEVGAGPFSVAAQVTNLWNTISVDASLAGIEGEFLGPAAGIHRLDWMVLDSLGGEAFIGRDFEVSAADAQAGSGLCTKCTYKGGSALDTDTSMGCVVGADHVVYCWGSDAGTGGLRLSRGTSETVGPWPSPVCVTGSGATCVPLSGARSVGLGTSHACSVMQDGSGQCWGDNGVGQRGWGVVYPAPPRVNSMCDEIVGTTPCAGHLFANVIDASVSDNNTLIATGDGIIANLGEGFRYGGWRAGTGPGKLCHGGNWEDDCAGGYLFGDVAAVDLLDRGCAIQRGGTIWCWGFERDSEGRELQTVPHPILWPVDDHLEPITGVVSVANSRTFGCVSREDGSVWCWGYGFGLSGAKPLCLTAAGQDSCEPLADVRFVRGGSWCHACAVMDSSELTCWDCEDYDDPRDTTMGLYMFGYKVCESGVGPNCEGGKSLAGVVDVSIGPLETCALVNDGRVLCWQSDLNSAPLRPLCSNGAGPDCTGGEVYRGALSTPVTPSCYEFGLVQ